MLFRAILSVGLVWLLAPIEPDLGLGQPMILSQFPATAHARIAVLQKLQQIRGEIYAHRHMRADAVGIIPVQLHCIAAAPSVQSPPEACSSMAEARQ